jgi:general stress protein 26
MPDPRINSAFALANSMDLSILSTLDDQGSPDARALFNLRKVRASVFQSGAAVLPLAFATWIATNTSSRKVRELRADTRGSLYYYDPETFEGLTLQGTFEEIRDREIRSSIWVDTWSMYYPGGVDGGDFSIFRFHPLHARYYHGLSILEFDPSGITWTDAG